MDLPTWTGPAWADWRTEAIGGIRWVRRATTAVARPPDPDEQAGEPVSVEGSAFDFVEEVEGPEVAGHGPRRVVVERNRVLFNVGGSELAFDLEGARNLIAALTELVEARGGHAMTTITNRHGFIVEDGGDWIRVTLPDWLTPDQHRRFEGELDGIFPPGSRVKRRRPEAVSVTDHHLDERKVSKPVAWVWISTAMVTFVHDEAPRQGIELSISHPPTVDELKAAADALGMKPSDIARKAEESQPG